MEDRGGEAADLSSYIRTYAAHPAACTNVQRHFGRYTPEMRARLRRERRVLRSPRRFAPSVGEAGAICSSSADAAPEGVQIIRSAAILHFVFSDVWRDTRFRGTRHPGSTDIPTLRYLAWLPPMPFFEAILTSCRLHQKPIEKGWWANFRSTSSAFEAYYGDASTKDIFDFIGSASHGITFPPRLLVEMRMANEGCS